MIQRVMPPAKRPILTENALEFSWNLHDAFFTVEFHLKPSYAAFEGSCFFLHALVDQQKVPAFPGRKQRGAKREAVDFTFHLDLAAQPPEFGCIERYVDDDPVEPGSQPLQPRLEALRGGRGLGFEAFGMTRNSGALHSNMNRRMQRYCRQELNSKKDIWRTIVICPKCGERSEERRVG